MEILCNNPEMGYRVECWVDTGDITIDMEFSQMGVFLHCVVHAPWTKSMVKKLNQLVRETTVKVKEKGITCVSCCIDAADLKLKRFADMWDFRYVKNAGPDHEIWTKEL